MSVANLLEPNDYNINAKSVTSPNVSAVNLTGDAFFGGSQSRGVAIMAAGVVTIPSTIVTAPCSILFSSHSNTVTGSLRLTSVVNNVSFTISSSNPADAGEVSWLIVC